MDPRSAGKLAAATAGVGRVRAGQRVALGTGSTSALAIRLLGERFPPGGPSVELVASSEASEAQARAAGLVVRAPRSGDRFDVMLDGADEVDPALNLTKGGGGALFREKLLARVTEELVILVDESKLVPRLGATFPIPVEIVPYARPFVLDAIRRLGIPSEATLRGTPELPYRTDNDHEILDVRFPGGLDDPGAVERTLRGVPGVVEVGLFIGLARLVIVGRADGTTDEQRAA